MTTLPDGTYDALIIDVARDDKDATRVEFVITRGEQKGNVLALRAASLNRSETDLIGMPVTITIVNGEPRVRFD
jgi:hypothetical protein